MDRIGAGAIAVLSFALTFGPHAHAIEGEETASIQDYYCAAQEATPDTLLRSSFDYSDLRQEFSNLAYSVSLMPEVRANVNDFGQVWGRNSASQPPGSWPGVNFYTVFKNLDRSKFVSIRFHVPAGVNPASRGSLFHGENFPGPNLTTAISPICGDFAPAAPYCLTTNRGPSAMMASWKISTGSPGINACALTPGQDYYINMVVTTPSAYSPDCNGYLCKVNVQNNVIN